MWRVSGCATMIAAGFILAGCGSQGKVPPPGTGPQTTGVFDQSLQPCDVSYDGMMWYSVPIGAFSPIDVRQERCAVGTLSATQNAAIPSWAHPSGPTKALFVATSLQEAYSIPGMQSIEASATESH